jgi:NAD(P) transhydrogenase subunit alpha
MTTGSPISLGVPRAAAPGERRVALVPEVVRRLVLRGLRVIVEPGAGEGSRIPDAAFAAAGAAVEPAAWEADVVITIGPPAPADVARMREGAVLVGMLAPADAHELRAALAARRVTGLALDAIPRTSRAQAMDALSSQATVSGYRGALLGAQHLTRFYPMLTTAAGTTPPARVLAIGAGVAGLQALATARRLGARTAGTDVRPEVAEEVRSVGAEWVDLGLVAAGSGGYARELSAAERERQLEAVAEAIGRFDVVITTAQVPGRRAPTLVTARAVAAMRPGSVVVDLAADSGGNCELTRPGEVTVEHGVTIVAPLNVPASMPEHASRLYAGNVHAVLELVLDTSGPAPALRLDRDDELLAAMRLDPRGEVDRTLDEAVR